MSPGGVALTSAGSEDDKHGSLQLAPRSIVAIDALAAHPSSRCKTCAALQDQRNLMRLAAPRKGMEPRDGPHGRVATAAAASAN